MSLSVSYPLENNFDEPSWRMKIPLWLGGSFLTKPKRLGSSFDRLVLRLFGPFINSLFKKQIGTYSKIQERLDFIFDQLLEIDQQPVHDLKRKMINFRGLLKLSTTKLLTYRSEMERAFPHSKEYFETIELTLAKFDRTIERLTLFDHLSQSADFLLTLPDDMRYAVMEFGMARVTKAMEADPEGKAEYEAERDAWLNADLGPVIEYED